MDDFERDDELSDEDLEELAFRGFYNPTGFFFKPGKRGNPNSMLLMAGKHSHLKIGTNFLIRNLPHNCINQPIF